MSALPWLQARNANSVAPSTVYVAVGNTSSGTQTTEAARQRTMLVGGTWANAYIRVITNDRTASSTLRSRVNGANGNQLITIGAGATGEFEDTANSDTVASGDEIDWELVVGTGGTSFISRVINSLYTPSSGVLMGWCSTDGDNATLNGLTRFHPLTGTVGANDTANQNEAQVQYSSRCAGAWKGLLVNVRTNAKGGNSFFKSRVNGANGGQSITIGAGVTGILQDTSGSDAVVSGDELNYSLDYFADGNALRLWLNSSEFAASTTAPTVSCGTATGALTLNAGVTTYLSSGLFSAGASTTESDVATEVNTPLTLSYLSTYVITNTTTANTTLRVRKNAGDGNNLLTIGSGATGYVEDASSADTFAATDECDIKIVTGATGTSIVMNSIAVLLAALAGRPLVNAGLVSRGLVNAGLVN